MLLLLLLLNSQLMDCFQRLIIKLFPNLDSLLIMIALFVQVTNLAGMCSNKTMSYVSARRVIDGCVSKTVKFISS